MIDIWVCVELRTKLGEGPFCSFIIQSSIYQIPNAGDMIVLSGGDKINLALQVRRCIHYEASTKLVVVTLPYLLNSYQHMLRQLDWFKTRYTLEYFESNDTPEPYYVLYRTIIDLLGIKEDNLKVEFDSDLMKMVVETIRTVYIAGLAEGVDSDPSTPLDHCFVSDAIVTSNDDICTFYNNLALLKRSDMDLLDIAILWDGDMNRDKQYTWDVKKEMCVFVGEIVFEKLRISPPFLAKNS